MEDYDDPLYIPALGDGLALLVAVYGALPVLLGALLAAVVRNRTPPLPPEPEVPVYGPVGFVRFD